MSRYITDLNAISPIEPASSTDFDDEFFQAFANDFVDLDHVNDAFTNLPAAEFETQPATGNADNTVTFEPDQPSSEFLTGECFITLAPFPHGHGFFQCLRCFSSISLL